MTIGAFRDPAEEPRSPRPGQEAPETVVAELRSSGGALVLPSLLLILVAGALGYLLFRVDVPWQRWAMLGGAALLVLLGFVLPLWAWSSRRYTITTRRTVLREGMIARRRREVLHSRVVEVVLHRSGAQRIAGSGDVLLELGQGRTAALRGVRSPELVQGALTDLIEAQRQETTGYRRSTDELPI